MAKISKERIGEYLLTALKILKENDGQMPSREVMHMTGEKLHLSDYEKETYEKTGYIRWQSILHFYSIGLVKAGWLRKKKGIWYITNEGIEALKMTSSELIKMVMVKYKEWKATQGESVDDSSSEISDEKSITRKTAYEQAISVAKSEIVDLIEKMEAYDFQDIVAALLRGMGYYTPFVAPRGKDGGFDILAYRDPLGTSGPRMKVQVKHRVDTKVTVAEVRELVSLLNKQDESGLMVSIGGFSSDAEIEMRRSQKHIEKMDLDDFINMWGDYYDKMKEEDKSLLPLRWIAYLAP